MSKMWPARKRKSLTITALQTQHASDQTVFSPCFAREGSGEQSPMTVLSNTLGCISVDTPKRCLFLGGLEGETPVAGTTNSRTASECSSESGCFSASPSPVDSAFSVVDQSSLEVKDKAPEFSFKAATSSQRRNSLTSVKPPVFSLLGASQSPLKGSSIEESDEGSQPAVLRPRAFTDVTCNLDKENVQQSTTQVESVSTMTTAPNDPASPSCIKEVKFSFAKPQIIPHATSCDAASSLSPSSPSSPRSKRHRPISAPATLLECRRRAQTTVEDSPVTLRHSRLTSSEDSDHDDGFSDIFDSDSNEAANEEVSAHFAGLMEAPIIHEPSPKKNQPQSLFTSPPSGALRDLDCNTMSTTPGPKCRRGIFKVPSQPVLKRSGSFLKRPDRPRDCPSPVMNKRPRSCTIAVSSPSTTLIRPEPIKPSRPVLGRSLSATVLESKKPEPMCIGNELGSPDLIGDHSKPYGLPLCNGKNRNLKSLSPETVCRLINSEFSDEVEEYHIIDCRFPYEYEGGHIKGALNLYTKDRITEYFLKNPMAPLDKRRVIVFHCEFSSKRGPSLLNFLRNNDRDLHTVDYPALYYPELYILDGGYKAFFEYDKSFCEPQTYKPMDHEDHLHDLKHFKAKSKSWAGERSRLNLHSRKLLSSESNS